MFEAYKIGVAIHLTNHVSGALAAMSKDFRHTDEQAALLQKRLDSIKLGLKGGLIAMGAGTVIAAAFKPAIDDAMKFERAMLRLKDIGGIDAKVVMQVRTDALSGKFKGIAAAESVDLVRDLHAAFGDAKEALEFMPLFAGMARVTQGKYGKSAVAGEEDVRALAKLAERRGGTKSVESMESAMDLSIKIQNASGGAVTPKDLLAFTARMGAMGNAMSNDGVMKMWALMQEQGGSKAGTALNSAMQNLVNGRGTEGSGVVLRKIGWVDEAKNAEGLKQQFGANWSKHLNKVTANSLKNSDLAKEDMVGWVQTTGLPLIEQYLTKQGITDTKKREAATVSLLAQALSNRLGADSIALIATQLPRIMKDYHIATGSAGLRDSIQSYDASPMARFQELHAKYETAMTNLGLGALPIVIPLVNRLASALQTFNQFAEKNPGTVKAVAGGLLVLAGALFTLGTASVVISGVHALGLAWPLLLRGVGWFAGLAGLAARGISLLGNGMLFLGRALFMNPVGLVIAAIAGAAYLLYRNWSTVGPYVMRVWEVIRYAFSAGASWIASKALAIWNFIKPTIDAVGAAWRALFELVKGGVSAAVNFIGGAMSKLWSLLANSPIGKLIGFVAGGIAAGAGFVWDKTKQGAGAAMNVAGTAMKQVYTDAIANNYAASYSNEGQRGSVVDVGRSARAAPAATNGSAVPPSTQQTVQVNTVLNLDSQKVGEAVTRHQAKTMSRPPVGPSTFDGSMQLTPVGAS